MALFTYFTHAQLLPLYMATLADTVNRDTARANDCVSAWEESSGSARNVLEPKIKLQTTVEFISANTPGIAPFFEDIDYNLALPQLKINVLMDVVDNTYAAFDDALKKAVLTARGRAAIKIDLTSREDDTPQGRIISGGTVYWAYVGGSPMQEWNAYAKNFKHTMSTKLMDQTPAQIASLTKHANTVVAAFSGLEGQEAPASRHISECLKASEASWKAIPVEFNITCNFVEIVPRLKEIATIFRDAVNTHAAARPAKGPNTADEDTKKATNPILQPVLNKLSKAATFPQIKTFESVQRLFKAHHPAARCFPFVAMNLLEHLATNKTDAPSYVAVMAAEKYNHVADLEDKAKDKKLALRLLYSLVTQVEDNHSYLLTDFRNRLIDYVTSTLYHIPYPALDRFVDIVTCYNQICTMHNAIDDLVKVLDKDNTLKPIWNEQVKVAKVNDLVSRFIDKWFNLAILRRATFEGEFLFPNLFVPNSLYNHVNAEEMIKLITTASVGENVRLFKAGAGVVEEFLHNYVRAPFDTIPKEDLIPHLYAHKLKRTEPIPAIPLYDINRLLGGEGIFKNTAVFESASHMEEWARKSRPPALAKTVSTGIAAVETMLRTKNGQVTPNKEKDGKSAKDGEGEGEAILAAVAEAGIENTPVSHNTRSQAAARHGQNQNQNQIRG